MIAPWIVPPNFLEAMRAGAGVGLQARAQDIQEQQHADQLGLSREELQARREQHAAALAESLRQHNALELYRQQEVTHQKALEAQAANQLLATAAQRQQQQKNFTVQQALRERAEKRLEDAASEAANFEPGEPVPIKLPTGAVAGYRTQRSPRVWEQVRQPNAEKELTPNAQIGALLRIASTGSRLTSADSSSPFYSTSTNALQQAVQSLNDMKAKEKTGPKKGDVEDGYRFTGDDPGSPDAWEKVDEE